MAYHRSIRESNFSKWDRRFLNLAEHVASWSKDPSTKVDSRNLRGTRNENDDRTRAKAQEQACYQTEGN